MKKLAILAAIIAMMVAFSDPITVSAQAGWAISPPDPWFSNDPSWDDESRWDPPESFGRWCPEGSSIVPDEWDRYADRCIPPRGTGNWGF